MPRIKIANNMRISSQWKNMNQYYQNMDIERQIDQFLRGDSLLENPQNQIKQVKIDCVKKLTKIYKTLIQRSQLRYLKSRGLCVIIKPNFVRPYLVQVIPYQTFRDIYVRNFKHSYEQLSTIEIISKIMTLLVKAKQFVGRNHFNAGEKCACSLAVHASWVYKRFKKTKAQDYRVRIPGTTGLLKVIFRTIFTQHLKTDKRLQNLFREKYRKNYQNINRADQQLSEKIKDHLQKIVPFTFKRGDNKQKKRQRTFRYLRKIDSRAQINPKLVNWAIQNFKKNTYTVEEYQMKESIQQQWEPMGPYKSQVQKQNENIQRMIDLRRKRLRREKEQEKKLIKNVRKQNEENKRNEENYYHQDSLSDYKQEEFQVQNEFSHILKYRQSNSSYDAFLNQLKSVRSQRSNQNCDENLLNKLSSQHPNNNCFEVMSNQQYYSRLQEYKKYNEIEKEKEEISSKSLEYQKLDFFNLSYNQNNKYNFIKSHNQLFRTFSQKPTISYRSRQRQQNAQDNFSLQSLNSQDSHNSKQQRKE